jgi:RNA polymerase sigma-70 factor (ECF subfamily)
MSPTEDFSQLLELARRGDQEALGRIARQYESKLLIVARVQLGPALRPYLDSQDLVQSVHRSLMVGLRNDKFDISSPEMLIALTVTMLRRKVARCWKRMRRQHRLGNNTVDGNDLVDVLTSLCAPTQDPTQQVQLHDTLSFLCQRMDSLERQIVDLRLQGFAAPEIATRLGLTSVNVRVRMTRLRQRLLAAGVCEEVL